MYSAVTPNLSRVTVAVPGLPSVWDLTGALLDAP